MERSSTPPARARRARAGSRQLGDERRAELPALAEDQVRPVSARRSRAGRAARARRSMPGEELADHQPVRRLEVQLRELTPSGASTPRRADRPRARTPAPRASTLASCWRCAATTTSWPARGAGARERGPAGRGGPSCRGWSRGGARGAISARAGAAGCEPGVRGSGRGPAANVAPRRCHAPSASPPSPPSALAPPPWRRRRDRGLGPGRTASRWRRSSPSRAAAGATAWGCRSTAPAGRRWPAAARPRSCATTTAAPP